MSRRAFRVSPWQLVLLAFAVSLGAAPLGIGRTVTAELGRQAWIAALPAVGVGAVGIAVAVLLGRRLHGHGLDRTAVRLLSPYLGYPYLVALALLIVAYGAITLHLFVASGSLQLLPRVPLVYPAALTASGSSLAAYFGPEVVGRCAEVVVVIAIPVLVVTYLVILANVHWGWLLPVTGVPLYDGGIWRLAAMAGGTPGFLPVLLLAPHARTRVRFGPVAAAVVAAAAMLAASLAEPVAVFGMPFVTDLQWPFLTTIGTVGWEWLPIHRIVVVAVLIWQTLTFAVAGVCVWGGAWLLKRTFRRLPWTGLVAVLGLACAAAASFSYPSAEEQQFLDAWNLAAVALGVLVPAVLLVAGAGRKQAAA